MILRSIFLFLGGAILLTSCGNPLPPPLPPALPVAINSMDPGAAAAIKNATEKVQGAPSDLTAWKQLGAVHLAHERFDDAKVCYEYLQRALPDDAKVHYFHAILSDKLGDEVARRISIDRAISLDTTSGIPQWRGALWAMELGELTRAEALSARAGASPSALKVRALVALEKGNPTEAIEFLRQAGMKERNDSYLHYLLGRALQANAQHEEAERLLLLTGETKPWFDDSWVESITSHRADLAVHLVAVKQLMTDNDMAAALARVERLLEVYGARRNLELMRINILMWQENSERAFGLAQKLLRDYPAWAQAHLRMATILRATRKRENVELAMNYAQTATRLAPGSAEAWFRLAGLATSLQEYNSALHAFEQCLAIDPSNESFRDGLINMLLASGDLARAATAIEEQETLFGKKLETRLFRVRWLEGSGRHQEAMMLFEECKQAAPSHPGVKGVGRMIGATP